jgi:predicted nucleotidyltransferase
LRLILDEEIAGRPAVQVRALLRRFNQEFWTVKKAANVLKIPEEEARRLTYWLRRLGYVEVVRQQRPGTWRNTMAGNALANATAVRRLSRSVADRLLKEFLVRVGIVNDDPSWLYRIGKVVIFGSYLKGQEWVGDIDVAIRLDRRAEFAERWPEMLLAKAEVAANRGRRFRGFLDRLAWPETEVRRYLRGGVRWLSLHDWTKEEPWLQHAAHTVLFEEERCGAAMRSAARKDAKVNTGTRRLSKRARS